MESRKLSPRLSKGQYFGEMALISNAPRNATVRSLTPVRMAILGKQNFLTMLSLLPQTQEDIMQTVNARAMSRRGEVSSICSNEEDART